MLLLIDGFDTYGTTIGSAPSPAGVVGRRYDFNGSAKDANMRIRAGRITAYSLELNMAATWIAVYNRTQNDTVVLGFAARFTMWDNDQRFAALLDGNTVGVGLFINTNGSITVKRGTTTLGSSAAGVIALNSWNYIELKVKCSSSAAVGTFELHVNGEIVCSGTANTQIGSHAYHDGFSLTGGSFHIVQIDDLYYLDSTGTGNNDFLGNARVDTMFPDGPGDSTQFTPDVGSNYARVNEAVSSDSSYVEDSIAGHMDLYNYGAVPFAENVFFGVQVTTECRETDAKSFFLITPCLSGSTLSEDASQAVGATSLVLKRRILESDPNTDSLPWTTSALNATQFGIKVG